MRGVNLTKSLQKEKHETKQQTSFQLITSLHYIISKENLNSWMLT